MRFTSRWNWNLVMLVFMEGGKPENPEKNPRSKDENQQQIKLNPHMYFVALAAVNGEYRQFWRFCLRRLPEGNKRKTREESFSELLQRQGDFHPEIRIAPLPKQAPSKAEMFRILLLPFIWKSVQITKRYPLTVVWGRHTKICHRSFELQCVLFGG